MDAAPSGGNAVNKTKPQKPDMPDDPGAATAAAPGQGDWVVPPTDAVGHPTVNGASPCPNA